MYKDNSQLRIEDFVFPYGRLDRENDWVKLAQIVPWETIEEGYAAQFVNNGHPAHPARMAFGALVIKQRLKCSDKCITITLEHKWRRRNFGVNNNITREQCIVMLWRYAGSPEPDIKTFVFNDAGDISPYAEEAMRWAVSQQIIGNNTSLYPQKYAKRAEVALMLKRFCEIHATQNIKQLEGC